MSSFGISGVKWNGLSQELNTVTDARLVHSNRSDRFAGLMSESMREVRTVPCASICIQKLVLRDRLRLLPSCLFSARFDPFSVDLRHLTVRTPVLERQMHRK